MSKELKRVYRENKGIYKKIYHQILKSPRIVVFRHALPDYDALGSQMGFVTFLKDNFPEKEIRYVGDNHVSFTPRLYPPMEIIDDEWFNSPFLALILDTGDQKRIADQRFQKASCKIKIDHHPAVENYGDINLVLTSMAAVSEILVNLLSFFPKKNKISVQAGAYLYSGIVGDSGRFLYSSTSPHTFAAASRLLETGLRINQDVYQKMYLKTIEDLKVTAYILNNFTISEKGVAYYTLDKNIQEELKITPERGKENVNIFSGVDGVHIWCSITEDPKDNVWRISIRSKGIVINKVAALYGGGGHAQASGAKIDSLKDLPLFIKSLDDLIA